MTARSALPTARIVPTARGPVECAVIGHGRPVVVLHGSPGGLDAAAVMARFLPTDRFAAVLLSRPGYLRTPLAASSSTIDQQADLVAALLDELDIARAAALSWSGGGPAGYRLTVRHPDRVSAHVAVAAVSRTYVPPRPPLLTRLLSNTGPGRRALRWLAAAQPRQYVTGALAAEGDLDRTRLTALVEHVIADDDQRRFVLDIGATAVPDRDRRAGYRNDLRQFAAIDSLDLETVTTPTLVVHGDADADLPPAYGDHAAAAVPDAEHVVVPGGTHFALFADPAAPALQRRVVEFLHR